MEFVRSSFCDSSACLEAASDGERVFLRSTEAPDFWIVLTRNEWEAFIQGARAGDFEQV
jgi:hypothetical protein